MALSMMSILPVFAAFFAILALVCAGRKEMDENQIKVAEFDVKPGAGRQEYVDEWDGITCKFVYQAQGGTKEQWILGVTRSKDQTEYACSVERSGGGKSYLFFEEFKMIVDGPGMELETVDLEKEPGVPLQNSEYAVVNSENHVHNHGSFESQLSKVEVYATRAKQEL